MPQCLFCLGNLDGVASIEHIIPAALGGSLTVDQVCKECNDLFGHDIEKFVDDSFFGSLRREAGLTVAREDEGDFYDIQAGAVVAGRLDSEGRVKPVSPVFEEGNRVLIRGESSDVQRIARAKAKRAERAGRTFQVGPIEPIERHFVRVHTGGADDLTPLIDLLKRDAAKMILEYVALTAGPELCLVPELDPLRRAAMEGKNLQFTRFLYDGPGPAVLLPRTKKLLHLEQVPDGTQAERRRQFEAALPPIVSDGEPDLSQFPTWPSLNHVIGFWMDDEVAFGFVTLFGSLQLQVALPPDLDVPWGTYTVIPLPVGRE